MDNKKLAYEALKFLTENSPIAFMKFHKYAAKFTDYVVEVLNAINASRLFSIDVKDMEQYRGPCKMHLRLFSGTNKEKEISFELKGLNPWNFRYIVPICLYKSQLFKQGEWPYRGFSWEVTDKNDKMIHVLSRSKIVSKVKKDKDFKWAVAHAIAKTGKEFDRKGFRKRRNKNTIFMTITSIIAAAVILRLGKGASEFSSGWSSFEIGNLFHRWVKMFGFEDALTLVDNYFDSSQNFPGPEEISKRAKLIRGLMIRDKVTIREHQFKSGPLKNLRKYEYLKAENVIDWFRPGTSKKALIQAALSKVDLTEELDDMDSARRCNNIPHIKRIFGSKTAEEFVKETRKFIFWQKGIHAEVVNKFSNLIDKLSRYDINFSDVYDDYRDLFNVMQEKRFKGTIKPATVQLYNTNDDIKEYVLKLLGSRKKGIKGKANDPRKLFYDLSKAKLWPKTDCNRIKEYNQIFKNHNCKELQRFTARILDKNDYDNLISGNHFGNCMALPEEKLFRYCAERGIAQLNTYADDKWTSNSIIYIAYAGVGRNRKRCLVADNIESRGNADKYSLNIIKSYTELAKALGCKMLLIGTRHNDVNIYLPKKSFIVKPVNISKNFREIYSDAVTNIAARKNTRATLHYVNMDKNGNLKDLDPDRWDREEWEVDSGYIPQAHMREEEHGILF